MSLLNGSTLFIHPVCPFAHRSFLALHEYGFPLTSIVSVSCESGLYETMKPWFIKNINSEELVPVLLEHNSPEIKALFVEDLKTPQHGHVIHESLDIVKRFEQIVHGEAISSELMFPKVDENIAAFFREFKLENSSASSKNIPRLYPREHRAAIDKFIEVVSDVLISPIYETLGASQKEMNENIKTLAEALIKTEEAFCQLGVKNNEKEGPRKGPFFLGEQISLADISIIPFLERFRLLHGKYCNGFDFLDAQRNPNLVAMFEATQTRLSYRVTAQTFEFYERDYLTMWDQYYVHQDNPVAIEERKKLKITKNTTSSSSSS